MSHERPPQHQGIATLTQRQLLTPRFVRLHFHAPALAAMDIRRPAHALHVWFGPDAQVPPQDKAARRVFTLRQFDAARASLAIDVLLHGPGLASQWARQARPGDTLAMAGPRSGFSWTPGGEWLLAVVDETAMPALATIVEHTPASRPIHALLALQHESERAYFDALQQSHRHLQVTHLVRTPAQDAPDAPAPSAAAGLEEAEDVARALNQARWPGGQALAFIAGESLWTARLRACLESMPGRDWHHIHASGYWRHGLGAYRHG